MVDEDNKTLWLYEQWETKEDHKAYLGFRIENGFEGFMEEILVAEVSISSLTNAGAWWVTGLTTKQIKDYNENGYIAPIDILSLEQVKIIREEIEYVENNWPDEINRLNRNNIHYYSPIFDQVVHNSKILDSVENIIGHNILAAGTVLFVKEPDKKGFVSWHQDGKYQGWKPYNYITGWLAITDVNEVNGCMRMWQGSHKENFKEHIDTYDEDNLLTRGQTIENVPMNETVPILLKPG